MRTARTPMRYGVAPSGASIMGMYREVQHDKLIFYELWAIELDGVTLVFKMKHSTLATETRWCVFLLSKASIRYVLEDANHLTSALERMDKEGKRKSDVFRFHRAGPVLQR